MNEKINQIKNACNMVEIEAVLNSVTSEYLNRYSTEIEKAPNSDNYGSQSKWVEKAVRFFIADIHRDKLGLWQHIDLRFKRTAIYQRLLLSQFLNSPVLK